MVLTISEVIELPVPVIIGLVVTYVVDKIPEVIEVVSDEDEFMSIMVLATVEVDICGEIDGVRLSVVVTLECDSVRGLSVVVTLDCDGMRGLSVVVTLDCDGVRGLSVVVTLDCDGVRGLSVVVTLDCDGVRGLSVVVTTLRLGTVVLTTLKVDMVPELDV